MRSITPIGALLDILREAQEVHAFSTVMEEIADQLGIPVSVFMGWPPHTLLATEPKETYYPGLREPPPYPKAVNILTLQEVLGVNPGETTEDKNSH